MDTATLIAVDLVLSERSIRGAARSLNRPISTIAASVDRVEADVSVRLAERAGSSLTLSLDAIRLAPEFAECARLARSMSTTHPIKLDALERFIAVTRQGSIRRAARGMGVGQPQLTRQIAQLEAALGQALLQRGSAGSSVTPFGATVAATAELLLTRWRAIANASGERFRKAAATARLGSVIPLGYESEIARLLANVAARWLVERPRSPLFVSSTTAEDLLAGLKSGLFDAAFLDTERLPSELDGQVIGQTPLAIVGASRGASIAEALLGAPLAVPSPRSGLRQRINRILDDHLSPSQRAAVRLIEIDSIPVILNLVLHHGFVSVLPLASVTRIRCDLHLLPLPGPYDMSFWLCWPRGSATIGQAILATIDQSSAPEGPIAKATG